MHYTYYNISVKSCTLRHMTILKTDTLDHTLFSEILHDKVCQNDLYSQYNGDQHSRLYRGIMIAEDAEHPAAFGI